MKKDPPFDGVACPMCPVEARGLFAVAYNLCVQLRTTSIDSESLSRKFHELREYTEQVSNSFTPSEEIRSLYEACVKVTACTTYGEIFALKEELLTVVSAAELLCDKHFANRAHSHGC